MGCYKNLLNKTLQVLAPEGFKSRLPKGRNKKSEKGIKVSQRGSQLLSGEQNPTSPPQPYNSQHEDTDPPPSLPPPTSLKHI